MRQEWTTYQHFSEEDLMNDALFQEWIIRPDAQKDAFWNGFLQAYPEKSGTVETARQLLKHLAFKEDWPSEQKVQMSLEQALSAIRKNGSPTGKLRPIYRKWWMAAAAAVLLLLAGGWWFVQGSHNKQQPSIAATPKVPDIAPGGNKAILTLADGTQVVLDSANNGALTKQGNVTVIKLDDGQLAYNASSTSTSALTYNTVTTPRGGQYQLVLSDGTKVWLNAASSLRFPTAFVGSERKVEMTGEGYFEVAHNDKKPFLVRAGGMDVEVLGTHFNINAYEDEGAVKTTLLEGKVRASAANGQAVVLKPGEQARLFDGDAQLSKRNNADLDEVIAWKNQMFVFNSAPLASVMRQIERWYDVEVEYQGHIPQDRFIGTITRNTNLSEVLKVLEYSNVRFKVEGKKITVMP
jgi:ferric-dicitrate binding protein FerR (iron transport regulator)